MPTPPKPILVLESEGRSHRTKKEKELRKQGEEALLTGKKLTERPEVKADPTAHKEYQRVNAILRAIHKNDALYTGIINRYCILYAECQEMEQRREEFRRGMDELREEREKEDSTITASEYFSLLDRMQKNINTLDSLCGQKRKMLLDIEKECLMTIAAALRSIPKKVEKEEPEDPMAALLERRRAKG